MSQNNFNSKIVKNSINAEIATLLAVGKYDFSYERFIFEVEELEFFSKINIGEWYYSDLVHSSTAGKSISISICEFSSISNHRFELSLGGKYVVVNEDRKMNGISSTFLNKPFRAVFTIGYRYQKHTNGVIFRCFACDWGIGIGLGYGF
jgi:hypothetical protein